MMDTYERCEGYPDYNESKNWGIFGYPSEMLHRAVMRDDPEGFRFYWDRYFNKDCWVWSNKYSASILEYVKNNGAKKCAAELGKLGVK